MDTRFHGLEAQTGRMPRARGRIPVDPSLRVALGDCSLGALLVAQNARGLCTIELGDDPQALIDGFRTRCRDAARADGQEALAPVLARVAAFVESPVGDLGLPLDLQGTPFQRSVWQALQAIPAGRTDTYTALAQRIGRPSAVRAVAQACAANRLAVVVPCHRVLRRDGDLAGYRWGIERKRALLSRESAALRN